MKFLGVLVALACPLHAELLAHVQTSLGAVDVALQYDKAPQAVANFITLAQGTRSRIDPGTGSVINTPLYIGEKFFRVVNSTGFLIAQTGSGTGTNSGGPGFTFKDEFTPALTHVPYVLSMANSGPNTNGGQIFFTGNTSIPSLNNVHTIFGLVSDPASQAVIDAIINAGSDGSQITAITFSRTDPGAEAFDEFAQGLPTVSCPRGNLQVARNVSATWILAEPQNPGDIFRAFRSTTLTAVSWSELPNAQRQNGLGAAGFIPPVTLDDASAAQAFYHLTFVKHPGSVAPSNLASRTVTVPLGSGTLTYAFDASGTAGTTTYSPTSGDPLLGPFTTIHPSTGLPLAPFLPGAHAITFVADTPALNPRYLWVKIGCDSATESTISGHQSTQGYQQFFGWQPFSTGPVGISR